MMNIFKKIIPPSVVTTELDCPLLPRTVDGQDIEQRCAHAFFIHGGTGHAIRELCEEIAALKKRVKELEEKK